MRIVQDDDEDATAADLAQQTGNRVEQTETLVSCHVRVVRDASNSGTGVADWRHSPAAAERAEPVQVALGPALAA